MFLGKSSQEIAYPRAPQDAFEDVRKALAEVGKVKSADESTLAIKGSVKGGGWVVLDVQIAPADDDRSVLKLNARCDDVWGAGARRGIARVLAQLPYQADAQGTLTPAVVRPQPRVPPGLGLTTAQQVVLGGFLLFVSLASLDVAWKRGLFPLSLSWLYLLASLGGAFTGFVLVRRRYLAAGILSGVVAGLTGVAFSLLVFSYSTYTYKIVIFFTAVLGCLPGLLLFAALRALQDHLFLPRPAAQAKE